MTHRLAVELQLRSSGIDERSLLQSMGYPVATGKARQRLRQAIHDPAGFLEGSSYDFRYGNAEFLRRLGRVLGLPRSWLTEQVDQLEAAHRAAAAAFRPWLFIDTGFQRRSEPVVLLALLESQRQLRFPRGFAQLPLHEQVARAQARVREHMDASQGVLPLWGTIRRYVFHYAQDAQVVIDTRGALSAEVAEPPGSAMLTGPLRGLERWLVPAPARDAADPPQGHSA
jgi:hypothetical protein